MTRRQALWWVLALTVVGLGLRLVSINSRGLWLDEAITIYQAQLAIPELLSTMMSGVHPPLFHLLVRAWASVLGTSEVAIRGFAATWGVLSIPASYWATRAVYDRRTALIAALLTSVSPYFVWYSQEARMYAMMMFFGFMSIGFYARAIAENRKRDWVGYSACTFFGLFTHYFFAFLVLGEVLHFIVVKLVATYSRLGREGGSASSWSKLKTVFAQVPTLVPWLVSMAFLGTTYLLWLSRSLLRYLNDNALVASATGEGLGYGQTGPSLAFRFNDSGRVVVEMLVGFQPQGLTFALVAMWPLLISAFLMLFDHMGHLRRRASVLLWSAVGLAVILALGVWQGQVLASRYFVAAAAPAAVLIAAVVGAMPLRRQRVVLVAVVAVSIAGWASQSYHPDNPVRFEYREAFQLIAQEREPSDIMVFEPFYLQPLVEYYVPNTLPVFGLPRYGPYGVLRQGRAQLAADLSRTADLSRRVWLVLSFQDIAAVRGDAYHTMKWFERNGFRAVDDRQLNRVRVILYESQAVPPSPFDPAGVAR